MALSIEMQPLLNSLTPEAANDPEKLKGILIPLCPTLKEYITAFSGIVQTIKAKADLLNEQPIISTELFNGQHTKMKELLSHLLSSQSRLLEGEKQAYVNLQCDTYQAFSSD